MYSSTKIRCICQYISLMRVNHIRFRSLTKGCMLTVKMMRNIHKWRVFYIVWWREFEMEWIVKEWLCWCESWRKLSWTQSHLPRGQTKSSFFHTYMKNTRSLEGINHYRQSVHTYFHTFHWMSALDDRIWSFNINVDMCIFSWRYIL